MNDEYIPKYIIVHHSAFKSEAPQFDQINQWHQKRGFVQSSLGFFVGYHRVIERDGTVRKAREDTERDCDALGHNFDSLSVCLAGNMDIQQPTPEQTVALAALLQMWCSRWQIDPSQIFPHRHFATTSCYGKNLADDFASRCKVAWLMADANIVAPGTQ